MWIGFFGTSGKKKTTKFVRCHIANYIMRTVDCSVQKEAFQAFSMQLNESNFFSSVVNDDWNYLALWTGYAIIRMLDKPKSCVSFQRWVTEKKNALNQTFSVKWRPPKMEFIFYATKQRRFYFIFLIYVQTECFSRRINAFRTLSEKKKHEQFKIIFIIACRFVPCHSP